MVPKTQLMPAAHLAIPAKWDAGLQGDDAGGEMG